MTCGMGTADTAPGGYQRSRADSQMPDVEKWVCSKTKHVFTCRDGVLYHDNRYLTSQKGDFNYREFTSRLTWNYMEQQKYGVVKPFFLSETTHVISIYSTQPTNINDIMMWVCPNKVDTNTVIRNLMINHLILM